MSVINTNVTSLIAQQNLNSSKGDLTTAMERLSSGLRINSAADDAAGQAIANRMSAQVTGLSQAQRNANDGISVAQTTEGALNQINDNLQRVRELTVQAQNGTNSSEDLGSIQDEINQRLSEINRISEETDFNGVKVLASDQSLSIQVGANDGETIDIALEKINAAELGLGDFQVAFDPAATASDVLAKTETNGTVTFAGAELTGAVYTKQADGSYEVTTASTGTTTADVGDTLSASEMEATVANNDADVDVDVDGTTTYTIASADGAVTTGGGTALYVDNDGSFIENTAATYDEATVDPLATLDSALSTVDGLRSDLGAIQNRFDSAITNLATTETNLTSARSRIQDADYATEVSNMTRNQILQQAGTSILAQANQLPQSVLSLLG